MFETKVKSYRNLNQELIEVQTDKGSFVTKQLIISAGLWVNEVLSDFKLPLVIQKNSVAWFENNDEEYQIGNMPCFLVEYDTGKYTYGFPNALGTGVKIGLH
jgi:glycine/D-amino acid oxidase-like deaminating enzyme